MLIPGSLVVYRAGDGGIQGLTGKWKQEQLYSHLDPIDKSSIQTGTMNDGDLCLILAFLFRPDKPTLGMVLVLTQHQQCGWKHASFFEDSS